MVFVETAAAGAIGIFAPVLPCGGSRTITPDRVTKLVLRDIVAFPDASIAFARI